MLGDSKDDCADSDCVGDPACQSVEPVPIIMIRHPAMQIQVAHGVVANLNLVVMQMEAESHLPIAVIMMMRQPARLTTADGTRKS